MSKHSNLLKDEAVELAAATSLANAVALTGVGYWSIRKHGQKLRAAAGIKLQAAAIPAKYTLEQRKECERLANNFLDSGTVKGKIKAWDLAGQRLGVNGASMRFMLDNGVLYAPFNVQQPSGASSGRGSVKTAIPHA